MFQTDEYGRPIIPNEWLVNNRQPARQQAAPTPSRRLRSPGLWERFDETIIAIGNAIARNLGTISGWTFVLSYIGAIGLALFLVIGSFMDSFADGILSLFVAVFVFGATWFALNVMRVALLFVLALFRLIFWRGLTFVLLLVIAAAIIFT